MQKDLHVRTSDLAIFQCHHRCTFVK
uniref:Uncharacterized protein n=1 Tax=Arundo donax TaxID=35708 RepID=A0A0A9BJU2_ARUDO